MLTVRVFTAYSITVTCFYLTYNISVICLQSLYLAYSITITYFYLTYNITIICL